MADIKKEQEREELHRAIWAIADDLRGSVDGWDFKSYVLGTMFYRYISENLTNYINEGERAAGNPDFDYAQMPDDEAAEAREGLIEEKGFFGGILSRGKFQMHSRFLSAVLLRCFLLESVIE